MLAVSIFDKEIGPVARRWMRVRRYFRWLWKGIIRAERVILIESRWRLGDEIMALPIYAALKKKYPRSRIEALCNFPDLLTDNHHVTVCRDGLTDPDRHIVLRGAPTNVHRLKHYARRAGVKLPSVRPTLRFSDWSSTLVDALPERTGRRVALATGASWRTKRWPKEHWRKVAIHLKRAGYQLIELGQKDEAIGVGIDMVGRTSVREAAAILRDADLLVCSDSGLMHLSLATGTPVLALFGPTDPRILIRNDPNFHPVANNRSCQGCWNVSQAMKEPGLCPLKIDECMETIAPTTIIAQVQALVPMEP